MPDTFAKKVPGRKTDGPKIDTFVMLTYSYFHIVSCVRLYLLIRLPERPRKMVDGQRRRYMEQQLAEMDGSVCSR
jgi:hypothetical protein